MKATIARPDLYARWKVASRHRPRKLDIDMVREIRQRTDLSQREKAKTFGMTQGLICRIEQNAPTFLLRTGRL